MTAVDLEILLLSAMAQPRWLDDAHDGARIGCDCCLLESSRGCDRYVIDGVIVAS